MTGKVRVVKVFRVDGGSLRIHLVKTTGKGVRRSVHHLSRGDKVRQLVLDVDTALKGSSLEG